MQHGYVAERIARVIRVLRPGIRSECCRMTYEIKDLNDAFPYRFAVKCLFHRHAFNVCSIRAMHLADHVSQVFEISHNAASMVILLIKHSLLTA